MLRVESNRRKSCLLMLQTDDVVQSEETDSSRNRARIGRTVTCHSCVRTKTGDEDSLTRNSSLTYITIYAG